MLVSIFLPFFAYKSKDLELSYDYIQVVPPNDPDYVYYKTVFKKTFGEDGNIFVIGFQDQSIFKKDKFEKFHKFCLELKKTEGVQDVFSLPTIRGVSELRLPRRG